MRIKEVKEILKIQETTPRNFSMEDLANKIGSDVTELRIINGITQEELAEKLNTKQSSIARLENGSSLPSLRFLYRIAKALNTFLIPPEFDSVRNYTLASDTSLSVNKFQSQSNYIVISDIPKEYSSVEVSSSTNFISKLNLH